MTRERQETIVTPFRHDDQRRKAQHYEARGAQALQPDHVALKNGVSVFHASVKTPQPGDNVLMSGQNSPKLGKRVVKGRLAGYPIFSLTLEERATCDRSCHHWATCYGNSMSPLATRWREGPELEQELQRQLGELQAAYPGGFLVRLHVLGDFYSVKYVDLWRHWLGMFPALHVFGYSERPPESAIGSAVWDLVADHWPRFAIRRSIDESAYRAYQVRGEWKYPTRMSVTRKPGTDVFGGQFPCPAQTDDKKCCANCGACWATDKTVSFIEHGKRKPYKKREPKIAPVPRIANLRVSKEEVRPGAVMATHPRPVEILPPVEAVDRMTFEPGETIEINGQTVRIDQVSTELVMTTKGSRVRLVMEGPLV